MRKCRRRRAFNEGSVNGECQDRANHRGEGKAMQHCRSQRSGYNTNRRGPRAPTQRGCTRSVKRRPVAADGVHSPRMRCTNQVKMQRLGLRQWATLWPWRNAGGCEDEQQHNTGPAVLSEKHVQQQTRLSPPQKRGPPQNVSFCTVTPLSCPVIPSPPLWAKAVFMGKKQKEKGL